MSMERAKAHLQKKGFLDRVIEPEVQTATVAEAAAALGCAESHIAKTLSFYDGEDRAILILAAGDAKIDNRKFKDKFGRKAKMLAAEDVEPMTGHAIGGVCPFGVNDGVQIYCDESLKRFDYVYPAAGNAHSGVKLTCEELFGAADALDWIDVCKGWEGHRFFVPRGGEWLPDHYAGHQKRGRDPWSLPLFCNHPHPLFPAYAFCRQNATRP